MRLVFDVHRTEDGQIEGQALVRGVPPVPFSGRLELLRAVEDALLASEAACGRDAPPAATDDVDA